MTPPHEYAGNLHMHTTYSDGEALHAEIARAAIEAELDFVVVTDHNVWVDGLEGYYGMPGSRQVLLLVGEEVHDMRRNPQVNHMLVFGAGEEVAPLAPNPQALIDRVNELEALCFLAHPVERAAPIFHEPDIPWVNWEVDGYTGIELWNYMSEFKSYLTSRGQAVRAAFNPDEYIKGPFTETLALWDQMLAEGKRMRVIGNSDAHGTTYSMGPLSRVLFPYEYLFRCVNTHILSTIPFNGELDHDRQIVLNALRNGHAFVGYDLPAPTRGFRFTAHGSSGTAIMGGRVRLGNGVTMQIVVPRPADVRLLKNGQIVHRETGGTHTTYIASQTGAYRVEAYLEYKGKPRGWIFSNPIYVVK